MSDYILSCCSTADMSPEQLRERNISHICFHYALNGQEAPDDLGQTLPFPTFYQAMREGADTATSMPSMGEYMDYFTPFLRAGKDVLHVSLSSGLSGAYNGAVLAAETLRRQFPERKLLVVDSLGASSGYGLLMDRLAELRDEGMDIDALHVWAEENKLRLNHWFFSTDLSFYVRGGRISRASGFFGGLMGICPLLNMDGAGHLIPREKIRSRTRVMQAMVDRMAAYADGGTDYSGRCFISHSDCYEDARAVADMVEARFPKLRGRVCIHYVGTTIGSHTGPGTVALFFWGRDRGEA